MSQVIPGHTLPFKFGISVSLRSVGQDLLDSFSEKLENYRKPNNIKAFTQYE
jgi:hypothetical protein